MHIYVILLFFIAYVLSSTFGFGGSILSLVFISLVFGSSFIKEVIFIDLWIGLLSGSTTYLTDRHSFNGEKLIKLLLFALPGVVIGTYAFSLLSGDILLKIFSVLLVLYGIKSLIHTNFVVPEYFRKPIIFMSGIIQGMMGTGGPFIVMGSKDMFTDKREMRVTLAGYFFLLNIIRLIQLSIQGSLNVAEILPYRPVLISIPIAIYIGYRLHREISGKRFTIGISIILLLSGLRFLF